MIAGCSPGKTSPLYLTSPIKKRLRRRWERVPLPNGMPPRHLPVVLSVLALVQMFLALRSRTSSLMPVTSRYRRKISRTRSASSSTMRSLPSFSEGATDPQPPAFGNRDLVADALGGDLPLELG